MRSSRSGTSYGNFLATEIGLLHSQLLTNSHLHFLIVVQWATFKVTLQHFSLVCVRSETVHTVVYVGDI